MKRKVRYSFKAIQVLNALGLEFSRDKKYVYFEDMTKGDLKVLKELIKEQEECL